MSSHDKTVRMFEAPNAFWRNIYQNGFGSMSLITGLTAWLLVIIWCEMSSMGGGFGGRKSSLTDTYFNWHPFLMSTAFLLFITPAVLSYEVFPFVRSMNKNLHGILTGLGLLSAYAGFAIIIDCRSNLSDYGNFKSAHGCLGLITIICLGLNYLGGFFLYLLKIGGKLRVVFKPLHKRLGFATVILGLGNICVGVQLRATSKDLEDTALDTAIAIGCLTFFTIIGVVFTVSKFMDKADGSVEYSPINADIKGAAKEPEDDL